MAPSVQRNPRHSINLIYCGAEHDHYPKHHANNVILTKTAFAIIPGKKLVPIKMMYASDMRENQNAHTFPRMSPIKQRAIRKKSTMFAIQEIEIVC